MRYTIKNRSLWGLRLIGKNTMHLGKVRRKMVAAHQGPP